MVQRTLTFEKGFRLFNRALSSNGTRVGVTGADWDLSGTCQSPVTVEVTGRRERFMFKHHVVQPRWNDPTTWESVSVIMHCKCRTCEACLKKKRIHWYFRAKFEVSIAPRTWFGTMTYNPDTLLQRKIAAERRCVRAGLDWSLMEPDMKFKHLLGECGRDVTLFVKTLRKRAKGPLRYLVVSEKHKSGEPHFHVLVHEGLPPISHRILKGDPSKAKAKGKTKLLALPCWRCGFSHFKLADVKAPGYVAKYISKDASARVRASERYGDSAAFSVSLPTRSEATGEGSVKSSHWEKKMKGPS